MARVYVAGPMRGIKDFNFPAFDKARDLGLSLGWQVISPADIDRESGVHETTNPNFSPKDIRDFALRDTDAILSLHAEDGDAMALLPGWWKSKGATAEHYLAIWIGLQILDATTFKPYNYVEAACQKSPTVETVDPSQLGLFETGTTPNPAPASSVLLQPSGRLMS